jgi:hypothetical protein
MATTTYLELDDQATGANNNTWGDVADANMAIIEQAIARVVSIATTGGTTVLTSAQNRYPIIRLTGTLVSNATIEVRTAEKNWTFINDTTGAYTVTVKTNAGTGKTLPRGRAVYLYCDGTNVEHARAPGIPAAQAGGTADAITATFEPPITAAQLQDGTLFLVEAANANATTTPTFAPDGLTARTITKNGGQALVAGDIRAAGHKLLLCYDLSSTRYELLNPTPPTLASLGAAASGAVTSSGLTQTTSRLLGRTTASTGAVEEISAGAGLGLASTTLSLNGPAFRATRTGNQTLPDNVSTKIQLQTEAFDTNSNYDNATNYRFTPTVEGYYYLEGWIWFSAGSGLNGEGVLYVNGADFEYGTFVSALGPSIQYVSGLVYLNGSTDYAELYGFADVTSGSVTVSAATFQGFFVRGA